MIRRTIENIWTRNWRLRPRGIKVLSLFFIDSVEKYRHYDEDGNAPEGAYARIFERNIDDVSLTRHADSIWGSTRPANRPDS